MLDKLRDAKQAPQCCQLVRLAVTAQLSCVLGEQLLQRIHHHWQPQDITRQCRPTERAGCATCGSVNCATRRKRGVMAAGSACPMLLWRSRSTRTLASRSTASAVFIAAGLR